MGKSWVPISFLLSGIIFVVLCPGSMAQLVPAESRILFQLQQLLEYPLALQSWNNWTNFCYLPQTPSLVIVCSGNHITELTIVGNRTSPSKVPQYSVSKQTLSAEFSLDSFFTVLTKLQRLQRLSLVSLGLWGSLSSKINRFRSLQVLNMSSNFIQGEIPASLATLQSLKTLDLSDNMLNGSVPDIKGLQQLVVLDLSDNHFGPKFPSLGSSLVRVSVKNNSLRSEIPQELKKLNRLQFLDVSYNKLIGPIPSFLFSLPSIQFLSLAKNQFTGALSPRITCNGNLSFVDMSNNLLIGKLPSCLAANTRTRAVGIVWNCLSNTSSKYQRPYSFCHKEALAVQPPARDKKEEAESSLKLGVVLGVIGGLVAILSLLGFLILAIYRKVQRNRRDHFKCDSFVIEKNPGHGSSVVNGRQKTRPLRLTSMGLPPYTVFTLEEMEEATNNFDTSNLVGEGSQDQLYKGRLRDGSVVLVKCLKLKQKHSPQALQQHVKVISKLRHRHLVSVLGHCTVMYQDHPNISSTVFIVHENIGNGSLREHLSDWRKRDVLKWPQRMTITMGIAKGVQFLHTGEILGNDLKTDSVLLDESLTPKISSYNISFPSKAGTESPINAQDVSPSRSEDPEKADIYRLGVILVEVITGRPINSQSELDDLKFQLERSLAESPSVLRDLTDPCIRGTFAYESVKTMVQITINCLCKDPRRRPTVEDVLWHMQYSVQVQEGWTSSGNLSGNFSGNLSKKM